LIALAIQDEKNLEIATLECKDVLGSVSHQLLEMIPRNLGIPLRLVNIVIDLYKDAQCGIRDSTKGI
jgi:hypothetical protein